MRCPAVVPQDKPQGGLQGDASTRARKALRIWQVQFRVKLITYSLKLSSLNLSRDTGIVSVYREYLCRGLHVVERKS